MAGTRALWQKHTAVFRCLWSSSAGWCIRVLGTTGSHYVVYHLETITKTCSSPLTDLPQPTICPFVLNISPSSLLSLFSSSFCLTQVSSPHCSNCRWCHEHENKHEQLAHLRLTGDTQATDVFHHFICTLAQRNKRRSTPSYTYAWSRGRSYSCQCDDSSGSRTTSNRNQFNTFQGKQHLIARTFTNRSAGGASVLWFLQSYCADVTPPRLWLGPLKDGVVHLWTFYIFHAALSITSGA